jgi:dihydrofolate reductase
MPQVIYYVAASLDGYIAIPDGGLEWLAPFEAKGEDYGYADFYESIDAVLLGSRTYEKSLSFGKWPFPGKPTWVFSRRQVAAAEPDVVITPDTPEQVMADLMGRGMERAWMVGGGALAASFREHRLITEYIVSVIPVILGEGIPLFSACGEREYLQLTDSCAYENGVVQLRYLQRK